MLLHNPEEILETLLTTPEAVRSLQSIYPPLAESFVPQSVPATPSRSQILSRYNRPAALSPDYNPNILDDTGCQATFRCTTQQAMES